jgi:hypothetical protein
MAVETNTIHAPIQPNFLPATFVNAPTGPILDDLPIANSAMINGTDQINRNITQGMRKDPPPFWATIRENLQMLPVPTAIPIVAIIRAQRDEKNSCFVSDIL